LSAAPLLGDIRPRPAFAGASAARAGARPAAASRWRGPSRFERLSRIPPFTGVALVCALFLAVGCYGSIKGGELDAFVAENGAIKDVVARALGFGITEIEVSGTRRLSKEEVAAASGIDGRGSLLFADADAIRDRLKANPMIADASVRKLYPHALAIAVVERKPFALWQKNGEVFLVAADGTPIDRLHDERYVDLPLVVGEGANEKAKAFAALIATQPSLKPLIQAGNWVGRRHWDLQLHGGLRVQLPEEHPEAALARFAEMMRDDKLADRAILMVDLRLPDRVAFRLTDEAMAQWTAQVNKALPPFKGEPE
jgi:cell division protein FtsQ